MKKTFLQFAALLLLASCGGDPADSDKGGLSDSLASETPKSDSAVLVNSEEGDEVVLPSSMRIAGIFKRSGLKFIETNLNSRVQVKKPQSMCHCPSGKIGELG